MTNGLPYYKRYPRDFIDGSLGLSFEAKGAYAILLDLIYMRNGQLPDDCRYIAGVLNCSVRMWKKLRDELVETGKIHIENGFISNFRAVSELERTAKYQDKQSENRRGSNKNKDLEKPSSDHSRDYTDTDTDIPPNPQEGGDLLGGPDPESGASVSPPETVLRDYIWSKLPRKKRALTSQAKLLTACRAALKTGDPKSICIAVRRCYVQTPDNVRDDGQFAPAILTWLRDGVWRNWLPDAADMAPPEAPTEADLLGKCLTSLGATGKWDGARFGFPADPRTRPERYDRALLERYGIGEAAA